MPIYQNKSGSSGVASFEISASEIAVRFKDGWTYVYSYNHSGMHHVEQMKKLAIEGRGLNSYINRYVGKKFARKF